MKSGVTTLIEKFLLTLPKKPNASVRNIPASNKIWRNSRKVCKRTLSKEQNCHQVSARYGWLLDQSIEDSPGGARVITYNVLTQEQNGEIELLLLYDKADAETIKLSVVKEIIRDLGFPI